MRNKFTLKFIPLTTVAICLTNSFEMDELK